MTYLWTAFELAINAMEAVLFVWFTYTSLPKKPIKIHKAIPLIISGISVFSLITFFNYFRSFEGIGGLLYSAVLFILSVLCLQGTLLQKILVSLIPNVCILLSSVLVSNSLSGMFKTSVSEMWSEITVCRLVFVLLANVIFALLLYVIRAPFAKGNVKLQKSEWLQIIAVAVISIFMFVCVYNIVFKGIATERRIFVALLILGIVLINAVTYFLLVNLSRKHAVSVENQLLRQQHEFESGATQKLLNQYDKLQKQRHDFKNNLTVIRSLCADDKPEQAIEYIDNYFALHKNSMKLIATDNDFVNAIVNSKLALAFEKGVNARVNTSKHISGIDDIELCSLLSNLLDNAITAAAQCPHGELELQIESSSQGVDIFVKNSVIAPVMNSNPDLKTTKPDKKRHGYGNAIIRDITRKYHGIIDCYDDDGFFCTNVSLYKNE